METFILLLLLIAATLILVFVHELGHFIFAKISGVYVAEFSVGFGPKIISIKYKETRYSIRMLPLGGYVSLLTNSTLERIEEVRKNLEKNPENREQIYKKMLPYDLDKDYSNLKTYEGSKYYQKVLIVLSGVVFNLIFAVVVLCFSYSNFGYETINDDLYMSTLTIDEKKDSSTSMEQRFLDNTYIHMITSSSVTSDSIDSSIQNGDSYQEIFSNCNNNDCYYGYDEIDNLLESNFESDITYTMYYSNRVSNAYTYEQLTAAYSIYDILIRSYGSGFESYQANLLSEEWPNAVNLEESFIYNDKLGSNQLWYSYEFTIYANSNIIDSLSVSKVSQITTYNKKTGWDNFSTSFEDSFKNMVNPWLDLFSQSNVSSNINFISSKYIGDDGNVNAKYYYANFNQILALLSSMLVLFNILPIPPMDGYKFFEATGEKLTGKEIPSEVKQKIDAIGWVVIMLFTVLLIVVPFAIY
ncbi:MAG: site-2 protease family protein [Mycoplasmataceae bacterium]|nr:site-2 protease family protein [Mycoplasmataceae bacterium]